MRSCPNRSLFIVTKHAIQLKCSLHERHFLSLFCQASPRACRADRQGSNEKESGNAAHPNQLLAFKLDCFGYFFCVLRRVQGPRVTLSPFRSVVQVASPRSAMCVTTSHFPCFAFSMQNFRPTQRWRLDGCDSSF